MGQSTCCVSTVRLISDYPQLIFTTENTEFTECWPVHFSSVVSVLSVVTAVTRRQNELAGNHQPA